jgi:hypothetical protein
MEGKSRPAKLRKSISKQNILCFLMGVGQVRLLVLFASHGSGSGVTSETCEDVRREIQ